MQKLKYEPLEQFLKNLSPNLREIPMTFEEIERIIGDKLPPAAFKHRPFWSNNPSNTTITNAWLNAGFESQQVKIKERRLVFRRTGDSPRVSIPTATVGEPDKTQTYAVELRHPLFGALKGTIRLISGTDLTAPADPSWGEQ